MPRSFAREPRPAYNVDDNEVFEAEFDSADGGGVKAIYRVNGRIAFPERRGKNQPKAGDIWKCRIAGSNPAGSVYFLAALEFVSNAEIRKLEAVKSQKAQEDLYAIWKGLFPEVTKAMAEFAGWDNPKPEIAVSGYVLPVTVKESQVQVKLVGVVHTYTAQATWSDGGLSYDGNPRFVSALVSREIVVPWSEVVCPGDFWTYSAAEHRLTVSVQDAKMRWTHGFEPVEVSKDWFVFKGWRFSKDYQKSEVFAQFCVNLPNDVSLDFEVLAGNCRYGKIEWEAKRYGVMGLIPDPDSAAASFMQAAQENFLANAETYKSMGILQAAPRSYWEVILRKWEMPGFGYALWADGTQLAIHPTLAKLFEGASYCEVTPLQMRTEKGVPEDAWGMIEWPFGREPNLSKIEAFLADVAEDVKDYAEEEMAAWLGDKETLTGVISMREISDSQYGKYAFDVTLDLPHHVHLVQKDLFGGSKVVRSQSIELRPVVFKGVAQGNEPFEGSSEVRVLRYKRWSSYSYLGWYGVSWVAPKTQDEAKQKELAAMLALEEWAVKYRAVLSGWRYTDNENPVVYADTGEIGYWGIWELDLTTFEIRYRKGAGSKKGCVYSVASAKVIAESMKEYASFGWPIERDASIPMGMPLKTFLGF